MRRYIKPVLLLIYEEGEKTDLMAGEALEAALKFPIAVSSVIGLDWLAGVAVLMIVISQFVSYPVIEGIKIFFGAVTGGVLVVLFLNFFFKLILRAEVEKILVRYPASLKVRGKRGFIIGIRTTLLASFTTLVILALPLLSFIDYSQARLALMEEIAQSRMAQLREQSEGIDDLIKKGQGVSSLRAYLDKIDVGRSGYAFILNEEGKRIAGELREELPQHVYNKIVGKKSSAEGESSRFLISSGFLNNFAESEDNFLAIDSKSIRMVLRTYLKSKGWYLAPVHP